MKQYPIIIGGFYRSGTSLLRRLLDSHSNIHCPPEIKFFKDFYGDYLVDDLSHVRFFSTVRTLGLEEAELLEIYGKAYIEARRLAATKLGKSRWADKNPENVLYLRQWHSLLDGKLFFIHVIRHPLDALASMNEVGFKKAVPGEFHARVSVYREFVEKALSYAQCYPDVTILVRYEDLVTNTEHVLGDLLRRLGETFELAMVNEYNSPKRQVGVEDPKVARTEKINSLSVGRWRKDLEQKQIDDALTELSSVFSKIGYCTLNDAAT